MSNEKFTPEEWIIEDYREDDSRDNDYSIIEPSGSYIAHIENCCSLEEQEANAYLIAAAPEMYYCICDALTDLQMPEGMRSHFEAVLKKARGE